MRKTLVTIICVLLSAAMLAIAKPKKKKQAAKPVTTSQTVRQQQQANNRAIRKTSQKIQANEAATALQLDSLNTLRTEIADIDANIARLNASIDSINARVDTINTSIAAKESEVKSLKKRYARAVRKFSRQRQSMSKMAFLMSSETFAQAYRRMAYMKQMSHWRDRKTQHIQRVQDALAAQRNELQQAQADREAALTQISASRTQLEAKRADQSRLVASLQQEGSSLRKVLRQQEQRARELDRELDRIIQEQRQREAEERRRKEEARKAEEARKKREAEEQKKRNEQKKPEAKPEKKPEKKPETKPEKKPETKPETKPAAPQQSPDAKLSGSFESNKGRLPYPVASYKMYKHFGRHTHPELKYVETNNSGIDLETAANAPVRAVFDGTVSAVFRHPGYNIIVMLRHGSYITIYAGLESINVKQGDTVKGNSTIGAVGPNANENGRYILHFELRKERDKLNPELWLR